MKAVHCCALACRRAFLIESRRCRLRQLVSQQQANRSHISRASEFGRVKRCPNELSTLSLQARRCASFASSERKRIGKVKLWNEERGFGFIVPEDGGVDHFVHRSEIKNVLTLSIGQSVSFEVAQGERRNKHFATNVEAIQDSVEAERGAQCADGKNITSDSAEPCLVDQLPLSNQLKIQTLALQHSIHSRQQATIANPESANAETTLAHPPPHVGPLGVPSNVLTVQTLDLQQPMQSQHQTTSAPLEAPNVETFSSHPPLHVDPLHVPPTATTEEKIDLMIAQVENLRLQAISNQRSMLQGVHAMVQQQTAQNANIERALVAIAERMGANMSGAIHVGSTPMYQTDNLRRLEQDGAPQRHEATAQHDRQKPLTPQVRTEQSGGSQTRYQPEGNHMKQCSMKAQDVQEQPLEHAEKKNPVESASTGEEDVGVQPLQQSERRNSDESASSRQEEQQEALQPFFIVGSFNDWSIPPEPMHSKGCRITVRKDAAKVLGSNMRREEFQILCEGNWDKRIFPAGRGEAIVTLQAGKPSPAAEDNGKNLGHGRNWAIEATAGKVFLILYDHAAKIVYCEPT